MTPHTSTQNTLFTKREIEILRLLAKGYTAYEIAKKLFLSFDTVRTHRKNILKKSGCKNTVHVVALCLQNGVL